MLSTIYPAEYASSSAQANVSSITFAGTVLGMLFFGYTSDHFSRKWSLLASTIIIILFAALGSGSYGAGGSTGGLLAALVAYRFFLGIGKAVLPFSELWVFGSKPQRWCSPLLDDSDAYHGRSFPEPSRFPKLLNSDDSVCPTGTTCCLSHRLPSPVVLCAVIRN